LIHGCIYSFPVSTVPEQATPGSNIIAHTDAPRMLNIRKRDGEILPASLKTVSLCANHGGIETPE